MEFHAGHNVELPGHFLSDRHHEDALTATVRERGIGFVASSPPRCSAVPLAPASMAAIDR